MYEIVRCCRFSNNCAAVPKSDTLRSRTLNANKVFTESTTLRNDRLGGFCFLRTVLCFDRYSYCKQPARSINVFVCAEVLVQLPINVSSLSGESYTTVFHTIPFSSNNNMSPLQCHAVRRISCS